jgi:hypothetical protein
MGMKTYFYKMALVFSAVLQLVCCGDSFPSKYVLELPNLPSAWVSLLGEPCWRVEWLNPDGGRQSAEIRHGASISVEIPVTWANPVTAWPFWSSHNMAPGLFKPSGALFPLDVDGNRLRLSWEAGPETVFYWELALANEEDMSRSPANFDWLRFRNLFKEGTLKEEDARKDPWLIDWRSVAERTITSGFRQTYLTKGLAVDLTIDEFPGTGPWYGASPFAEPLFFEEDEALVFPVRSGGKAGGFNVWVSEEGILKVSEKTCVFTEW